jgi:hypothetical protein
MDSVYSSINKEVIDKQILRSHSCEIYGVVFCVTTWRTDVSEKHTVSKECFQTFKEIPNFGIMNQW